MMVKLKPGRAQNKFVETSHITEKVDQDNVFEPNKRVKLGVKSIAEKAAKEQQKVIANEDIDDSSDGI